MTSSNPFPGLRPFRDDEAHLFFGRESQVDAMVDRLAESRFLAVVGTSGCGKSSVVNCGLRPALYRGLMAGAGSSWRMVQFRPGSSPIRALAAALARDGELFARATPSAGGLPLAEVIEANLRASRRGLVDICEQARLGVGVNVLIIVDQFEELFRFRATGAHEADETLAFANLLTYAREQTAVPIYVALTMRSDFLGDCSQLPGLPEAINRGQYLVPRLTREERRQAIVGPVAVGDAEIAPVLVTRLVNDVGDNPDQLSIMQHALNRTWARWENEGGSAGPITLADYDAIGTMTDALDKHAENAFAELTTDRQRLICEVLFKALTEKEGDARGVRRPTRMSTLCAIAEATPDDMQAVIDVFREPSRSFLMPPFSEPLHPDAVVDISHESLMRVWRQLSVWVAEEAASAALYTRLAQSAALHARGEAGLLMDPELSILLDWREGKRAKGLAHRPNAAWAERYHPGFDHAIAFLDQSRAARDAARLAEEQRRQREARRKRNITRSVRGVVAAAPFVALFTYSCVANSNFEDETQRAVRGVASLTVPASDLPQEALLRQLDELRARIDTIDQYRQGRASWFRLWPLYSYHPVYSDAVKAYYTSFDALMFGRTRRALLDSLGAVPDTTGAMTSYGDWYSRLKAYLMTTSEPARSTAAFLTPVLMQHWLSGRSIDPARESLARHQFDTYAAQLPFGNPYPVAVDAALVARTRTFLRQFAGAERIYQFMLSEAGKRSGPIQFNRIVPGSAQFVVDGYAVSGAYTADGATFMLGAFKSVDQYLNGESWVVGDDTTAVDATGLAAQLESRYSGDYIAQWQQFLQSASVVRYADMKDAATKLAALSGNQSPLLALFSTVARNTAIALPAVAKTFQSTQVITPTNSGDRLVTSANRPYVSALAALQASLDRAANGADAGVDQARAAALERASAARSAVQQVAAQFTIDQSGVQSIVQTLMMAPITYAEPLLRNSAVSDVNARARTFCSSVRPLLVKFPFAPYAKIEASLDEVAAVFRPKTGTLWRFYDDALVAVLPKRQGQYVPVAGGSVQLSPSFVSFINRAAAISDVLFAEGPAHLTIATHALPSPAFRSIALVINGMSVTADKGVDWPGLDEVTLVDGSNKRATIVGPYTGPWAIFKLFGAADEASSATDGSMTFTWTLRSESKADVINPSRASVRVDAGPAAIALRNGFFSGVSCGGEAAK